MIRNKISFRLFLLLGGSIALSYAHAADTKVDAPLSEVTVSELSPQWQMLLDEIHAFERVVVPFVETRSFSFRKSDKSYRGVFRKAADGSVSLAYLEPRAMTLHLGEGFAYYRKEGGEIRRIPQSELEAGAMAIFPKLLSLDLKALAQYYSISGAWSEDLWRLHLEERPGIELNVSYVEIGLFGHGPELQIIELKKNNRERITIEMETPELPDAFSEAEQAEYFFTL